MRLSFWLCFVSTLSSAVVSVAPSTMYRKSDCTRIPTPFKGDSVSLLPPLARLFTKLLAVENSGPWTVESNDA